MLFVLVLLENSYTSFKAQLGCLDCDAIPDILEMVLGLSKHIVYPFFVALVSQRVSQPTGDDKHLSQARKRAHS